MFRFSWTFFNVSIGTLGSGSGFPVALKSDQVTHTLTKFAILHMRVWLYTVRLKAKWLGPIVQVFFTSTSNLMFVTSFVVSGSLGFWHFSAPILGSKFVRPKPQKRGGKKSKLGNFSAISATLFSVSWSPHSLISAPAPLSPFSAPLPPYYYVNEYFFLVGINIKLFCLIGKIRIGSCKIIRK